jgi:hypothetical protein
MNHSVSLQRSATVPAIFFFVLIAVSIGMLIRFG